MTYKRVTATRTGPPSVLQVTEHALRPPAPNEVRIKVIAASVSRPDVTTRAGQAMYTGTPLGQKPPFVPGYTVIGDVDAVGVRVAGADVGDRVGALTVIGGYSEYVYWRGDRLIPVPRDADPAEAAALLLNYLVAYQVMHRAAKVAPGHKVLIIGASGGIGTACLDLGRLAGLKMYGLASASKHPLLTELGAIPIDYRTQDFADVIRQAEPSGLDAIFDGMSRLDYIRRGLALLRRGGVLVSYGEPAGLGALAGMLGQLITTNLLPDGKSYKLYGTSAYSLFNRRPLLEDWAALFELLGAGRIHPVIAGKFPLLAAAKAHELLESGAVTGNLVLLAPECL